jgi:outer membrane immunogenic protein
VKLLAWGCVAVLALAASRSATAADIPPVRKAPPIPVALSPWSGFYAGLNAGYGAGRNANAESVAGGADTSGQHFTVGPAGWLAGGQAGYNWLLSPNWVVGIEADWQWTSQRDSVCINACSNNVGGLGVTVSMTVEQQLTWLATLRGRVGYSVGPSLWYVTGGAAGGHIKNSIVLTAGGVTTPRSAEHTKSGWTLGAGVETPFSPGWTTKLEYLHVDLGETTDRFALGGPVTETVTYRVREHIVRIGVNRQFGSGPLAAGSFAAVPPRPATPLSWTGFYAGLNAGYGVGRNRSTESVNAGAQTNEQFTLAPTGWLAGGQAGYNWQPSANWLLGAETDWQWTNQRDSVCINFCTSNFAGTGVTVSSTVEQKIRWLATLRGRVGYAQNDWLLYVTGGAAWGRTTENLIFQSGGATVTGTFNHTKGGYVVGGGSESRIAGNWTAKLEYLYIDLGTVTDVLPLALGLAQTVNIKVQDHIFRAGLNYQFAPTVVGARY